MTLIGHYPPPVTLDPELTLLEALVALDYRGVRHAVVVDSEGRLRGLLTVKHLLKSIAKGLDEGNVMELLSTVKVLEVMNSNPPRIHVEDLDVMDVAALMKEHRTGAVAVVNDDNKVLGIVSEKHIAGLLSTARTLVSVNEVMTKNPLTLKLEDSIADTIKAMVECWCRHIPLTDEAGKVRAMITARDIISYVAEEETISMLERGIEPLESAAASIVKPTLITVDPSADLAYALRLMRKYGVSGLPVVDEGAVIGIVTERDLIVKPLWMKTVSIYYTDLTRGIHIARIVG